MSEPPHIRHFISTSPITIAPTRDLASAAALMEEHGVRHLPVLQDDKLVGLLSQRDIATAGALGRSGHKHTVQEAMSTSVFTCGPEAHIHSVATEMADLKYGVAVVVARESPLRVVGVFSTVDALRALALYTGHQD